MESVCMFSVVAGMFPVRFLLFPENYGIFPVVLHQYTPPLFCKGPQ